MKAIYISILAMAFGVNATVVEYQLEQDGVVDGVVTEGTSIALKVNKQQGAFSGYDESWRCFPNQLNSHDFPSPR
ncbi:hypothetical protein OD808_20825, partial [Aeromonas veronii]|uniref:hypothetical protein n=1 Tax=Aeromonas veronii TaxID=654 RepID=UPI0022485986